MTQDDSPGVNSITRERYGNHPKANPILSETTDCIQSTDYLHSKPDLLVNLDSSGVLRALLNEPSHR